MEEKEQEKPATTHEKLEATAIIDIAYAFLKKCGCYQELRLVSLRKSYLPITTGNGWIITMRYRQWTTLKIIISGAGKIISVS